MRFSFNDRFQNFAEVAPVDETPNEPPSPAERIRDAEQRRRRGLGPGVRVTAAEITAAYRKLGSRT